MTPPDFQDEHDIPDEPEQQDDSGAFDETSEENDLQPLGDSGSEIETMELEATPFVVIDQFSQVEEFQESEDEEESDYANEPPTEDSDDEYDFVDMGTITPMVEDDSEGGYDYFHHKIPSPLAASDDEFEVTAVQRTDFEDLTLSELIGQFVRAPRATWSAFWEVLQTPHYVTSSQPLAVLVPLGKDRSGAKINVGQQFGDLLNQEPVETYAFSAPVVDRRREAIKLAAYLVAFGIAIFGNWLFIRTTATQSIRTESVQLVDGLPWLIVAFFVWLGAEFYGSFPELRAWWYKRGEAHPQNNIIEEEPKPRKQYDYGISVLTQETSLLRAGLGWGAIVLAGLTWFWTKDNIFTFEGIVTWIGSIICIVLAFAPDEWHIFSLFSNFRAPKINLNFQENWTLYALIVIMAVGASFRFTDFQGTPPEMTSDHVEKLLDAQRVYEGQYNVFFANNGGREPFQMYAIALLTNLPGFGMTHETLKFLANLEALLTLPLLWLMGREVIGSRDRRLGNLVGLILAGLVAASYWHTSITRLALRIVLTPLVASLLVVYLSRAMRENKRADFIKAGMVLGFGLYTYQAVRMLPVVVIAGVLIAILHNFRKPHWTIRYLMHLAVLVIVSFVIFVPLARYWQQYPESFWQRTSGRLLGDNVITELDDEGNIVERNATIEERFDAFSNNMSVLASNIRNALLMYNWKGDVAWINGAPNYPIMDIFTGALLIIGLASWLVFIIKTRDAVFWLMPIMVFIMLLPSALSIAMPIENPSATRTSGSLPAIYLIASLPLALIAVSLWRVMQSKMGVLLATMCVALVIIGAYMVNNQTYFTRFRESYIQSSLPYSEAGDILHGFATSDGAYGNAFIIAYQYWWDHRAVGIEAGIIDYPNGVVSREHIPDFLNDVWRCPDSIYRLDPDRDLLFFYHKDDLDTTAVLQEWFPNGRSTYFESYQQGKDFHTYRVPALGVDGMVQFLETFTVNPRCTIGE